MSPRAPSTTTTPPQPPLPTGPAINSGDGRGAVLAALADALAGALGSVVAVAVFYPIDIAKTRAQASSSSPSPSSSSSPASASTSDHHHDHVHDDHRHGNPESSRHSAASGLSAGSEREEEGRQRQQRPRLGWLRSRTLAALLSIVRNEGGLTRLYEGIEAKALQALLGSFVYFYAYAFIKGILRRRVMVDGGVGRGGTGAGAAPTSLSPSLNLLAAAMAGAVNQAFTLPLENITTRMQTAPHHRPSSPPPSVAAAVTRVSAEGCRDGTRVAKVGARFNDRTSDGGGGVGGRGAVESSAVIDCGGGGGDGKASAVGGSSEERAPAMAVKMVRGGGDYSSSSSSSSSRESRPATDWRRQRRPRQSVAAVTEELYHEGGGIGRFWRGFAPSLILTCNPAINYTAFDVLKALWLRRRDAAAAASAASGTGGVASGAAAGAGTVQGGSGVFLNPLEAFLIAAAAKSLATLVTYPLIRAKVLLMTSPSSPPPPPATAVEVLDRRPGSGGGLCGSTSCGGDGDGDEVGDEVGRSIRGNSSGRRRTNKRAVDFGLYGPGDRVDDVLLSDSEVGPVVPPATETRGVQDTVGGIVPTPAQAQAVAGKRGEGVTVSNSRGMGTVLVEIFRREGLGGLYAGCGAQLLHTILKSALLLATKEQIARAAASAVFIGASRSGATGAVSANSRAASR